MVPLTCGLTKAALLHALGPWRLPSHWYPSFRSQLLLTKLHSKNNEAKWLRKDLARIALIFTCTHLPWKSPKCAQHPASCTGAQAPSGPGEVNRSHAPFCPGAAHPRWGLPGQPPGASIPIASWVGMGTLIWRPGWPGRLGRGGDQGSRDPEGACRLQSLGCSLLGPAPGCRGRSAGCAGCDCSPPLSSHPGNGKDNAKCTC